MTLSGEVSGLQTQVAFITQDLLQRPDIVAFSSYQSSVNAQLDAISDTLNNVQAQVQTLQNLYTNLYITVSENHTSFTGYTGSHWAEFTGHTGTTTGNGVHGHT
jgi:hypothetical protein